MTIRQLHEATGISTGRLSMLERGMIQPSPADQDRLARALQQSVDAIFPGVGMVGEWPASQTADEVGGAPPARRPLAVA